MAVAAGEERRYPDVAEAFVRLADDVGIGVRFDAVTFEHPITAWARPQLVAIDAVARDRLRSAVEAAALARTDRLVGTLVEADFERFTARLRDPAGSRISVRFNVDLADDIQEALRRQAELVGEVEYDPATSEARAVELKRIVREEQLVIGLEPGEFWSAPAIEELAAERGIRPVDDVESLRDHEATEEDVDRLLAALRQM